MCVMRILFLSDPSGTHRSLPVCRLGSVFQFREIYLLTWLLFLFLFPLHVGSPGWISQFLIFSLFTSTSMCFCSEVWDIETCVALSLRPHIWISRVTISSPPISSTTIYFKVLKAVLFFFFCALLNLREFFSSCCSHCNYIFQPSILRIASRYAFFLIN